MLSVSIEAMFVWQLFADGILTVASATLLCDRVAQLCFMSDMGFRKLTKYQGELSFVSTFFTIIVTDCDVYYQSLLLIGCGAV